MPHASTVPELSPLPLTDEHPFQGVPEMRDFPAGRYPSCSKHGAMNRVTSDQDWWRCLCCNIGVEWHRWCRATCVMADGSVHGCVKPAHHIGWHGCQIGGRPRAWKHNGTGVR